MEIKKERDTKLINFSADSSHSGKDAIFLNGNVSNTSLKKSQDKSEVVKEILELVQKEQGISLWKLSKILPYSHSKIYYLLRDLEFSGAIYSKIKTNKMNRSERVIFCGKGRE